MDTNDKGIWVLLGGIIAILLGIWHSVAGIGKDVKSLLDD